MQKWIILITILLIGTISVFIVMNVSVETEYIPESELEETELRKTIVSLYFKEKTSDQIIKETRMIDSKELLKNPYNTLISKLIDGPEGDNCEKIIPDNTKVIDTKIENGCVVINISKEFLSNTNDEKIKISIETINKTLKELTEVSEIKILVEGEEVTI